MPDRFQVLCAAIVALYVAITLAVSKERARFARRFVLLAVAAWTGEDSLMRAYGAYSYAPSWSGFLDRTPALIPCIWPVVVHSAWELARRLVPRASATRVAVASGLLVFADAAFIEPISVAAGLWRWTLEGPFEVPLAGVLSWGFFATACVAVLEHCEQRGAPWFAEVSVVALAPVATHVLALATWWLALRWIPASAPASAVAAVAWAASLALSVAAARRAGDGALAF